MTNDSDVPVTTGTVAIGGTDAAAFALGAEDCGAKTLAPGDTCTVSATFDPAAAGPFAASVEIPSDGGALSVVLKGPAGSRGRLQHST